MKEMTTARVICRVTIWNFYRDFGSQSETSFWLDALRAR